MSPPALHAESASRLHHPSSFSTRRPFRNSSHLSSLLRAQYAASISSPAVSDLAVRRSTSFNVALPHAVHAAVKAVNPVECPQRPSTPTTPNTLPYLKLDRPIPEYAMRRRNAVTMSMHDPAQWEAFQNKIREESFAQPAPMVLVE